MSYHATRLARRTLGFALILAATTSLGGCNIFQRLTDVGNGPRPTEINNPTQHANYRPVSMPMPAPKSIQSAPNSLWRSGARAFFKDQRASNVGDILSVTISIDDSATLKNKTTESRQNSETTGAIPVLGLEQELFKLFPNASRTALAAPSTTHSVTGDGNITRDEEIKIKLAATVIQILPNGNLAIAGRQETKINNELRELTIAGVIRPEDIASDNTITYEKIAEARIVYGGRGTLSDLQQPRWGQQVFDILFPF